MTDAQRIAALENENKVLRERIAKALAALPKKSPVRAILDITSLSATFNVGGSVAVKL